MAKLKYHQGVFELLSLAPLPSDANRRALEDAARSGNQYLPAAALEWFGLENGIPLLRNGARSEMPQTFKALTASLRSLPPKGKQRLEFIRESSGICWAIELVDQPDPPVYVRIIEADGRESWRTAADRFTEFIQCWIWDRPSEGYWIGAQVSLTLRQIRRLATRGAELPAGRAWPSHKTFRFQAAEGRIRVHYQPDGWTEVRLWSSHVESLAGLISHASSAGVPRQAFFSDQPAVARALSATGHGSR